MENSYTAYPECLHLRTGTKHTQTYIIMREWFKQKVQEEKKWKRERQGEKECTDKSITIFNVH